jgi:transmembrane sensor
MTPFDQKFIENPQFSKWIFNTSPAIELYWELYLFKHPEDKIQLLELKDRLTELKFQNDTLDLNEKKELERQINRRINLMRNKRRQILTSIMKYAAVALIFTAIGGLLVYLNPKNESLYLQQFSKIIKVPSSINGPMLITSNGENFNLKKSSSTVDYSHNGAIVINNDSVLQTADDAPNVLNQLVIPYGNQSKVVLSDNTVVWLNAGSRLVYPTLFKDKTREVFLVGEAYFEVSKNPKKPFIVNLSGIDIKVLGTSFNVSAYSEDNVIQTVLKEGSVAIRRKGANFFENDIVIKPNQLASFDKTSNDTKIFEVDADSYSFWTKGLIRFEEIDFSRVIKKVERFYNISINFSDPQKEIMRISGKLDLKQSRKEVMEYLEKVSVSRFEQVSENKYIIK